MPNENGTNGNEILRTNRIEYIDAMRGFTMILVVMAHVSMYNLKSWGTDTFFFHQIFAQFRMPLFFFVSGFVFYKAGFKWDMSQTVKFIKKKLTVQLISPFLFFLVFAHLYLFSITEGLYDSNKLGYWFTFALLEFYLFYLFFHQILRLLGIKEGFIYDILILLFGFAIYYIFGQSYLFVSPTSDLLGMSKWHLFLYFILGTLIRKHFHKFEYILSHTPIVLFSIIIYGGVNIVCPDFYLSHSRIAGLLLAPAGLVLIFALFHNHAETFSKSHKAGFVLQYIGRRTLDIYLLHFFFIEGMREFFPDFSQLTAPYVELIYSFFISTFAIAGSLAVSCILRLSPTLAHFLFGQKYINRQQ